MPTQWPKVRWCRTRRTPYTCAYALPFQDKNRRREVLPTTVAHSQRHLYRTEKVKVNHQVLLECKGCHPNNGGGETENPGRHYVKMAVRCEWRRAELGRWWDGTLLPEPGFRARVSILAGRRLTLCTGRYKDPRVGVQARSCLAVYSACCPEQMADDDHWIVESGRLCGTRCDNPFTADETSRTATWTICR